jgi:hypothetical protein
MWHGLLAMQQVRWIGRSILEKKICTVYYSRRDKQHYFGTGFVVNKRLRTWAIGFKPIGIKMCVLRTKVKFQNYSFICVQGEQS